MKEKLVEEWLIRAGERGGIDQAFGQWLITQGHEVLWLGHSSTEFGKDIITVDPTGAFHAFQLKDENLNLKEMRKIHDQVKELIELPPIHPRVPAGSIHIPHLVTSGIANEEAIQRIRALNDGLRASGRFELELVDRRALIPRFVGISDSFWPEKPANVRDFFSFYLAEGKGDFEHKKFGTVLTTLLDGLDESPHRKSQRIAAVALLANFLLNPFEREGDHWSLFQGWTMLAAHIVWTATRSQLPKPLWIQSFRLAKSAAIERLILLSQEGMADDALNPREWEFDDYTRARNVIVAACISATHLLGQANQIAGSEHVVNFLTKLLQADRLVYWGESATPLFCAIHWSMEALSVSNPFLAEIKNLVAALCERNTPRATDEPLEPPHVSGDEILARLFSHEARPTNRPPKARNSWMIQSLVHLLARRGERAFLEDHWREISKLSVATFTTTTPEDILLWQCENGHESHHFPERLQSWSLLQQEAETATRTNILTIFREDPEFALMFLIVYPHRVNVNLMGFLDKRHLSC